MADNYLFENKKKSYAGWVCIVFLFLSFVWISLYPAVCSLVSKAYWNFGDMLNVYSQNFSSIVMIVLTESLMYWLSFEIVFYLYRYVLQFKIYSFIVPLDRLKIESRTFFIVRNVFYGIYLNLCFLFPYLHIFSPLMNLIITFVMLLFFASHINKTYAEPIIGHFVFKNFCYPVFAYEAIVIIIELIGVL